MHAFQDQGLLDEEQERTVRALWLLESAPQVEALVDSRADIAHIEHEVLSKLMLGGFRDEAIAYLESGACRHQAALDNDEALKLVQRTFAES